MQSGNVSNHAIEYPKLRQIGDDWARITIDRMKTAFDKYKIKSRSHLYQSFQKSIASNNGVATIRISFLLYGKFVDMGVGRGVPIGDRNTKAFKRSRNAKGQLNKYSRKQKPFYSKNIGKETMILGGILVNEYSRSFNKLLDQMPQRIVIDTR